MARVTRRHTGGFTLVETLAAGMILALAATVLSLGVRQGLQALRISADLQHAAELADRVLTKIDVIGAATLYDEGPTSGEFDPPRQKFSWEADIVPMDVGDLYDVTVTIKWEGPGEGRSVQVQTLLRDPLDVEALPLLWEDL